MTDAWARYREVRGIAYANWMGFAWPLRVLTAVGFAGFIALLAQLSLPLPWTPVPFSFQPLAVLVTGACLGRNYALLSVAVYLGAGAVGLPVFAEGEGGLDALTGSTAGYLFGFAAAAYLVGWYVERRRRLLDRRWAVGLAAALGALALAALVTLTWIAFQGGRFESAWSATESLLWLFLGLAVLGAVAAAWLILQARGERWERLNLFLAMMAAIALIHLCGVVVLKPSLGVGWSEAVALGSTVFLPFDLVKAGLATAATAIFLPSSSAPSSSAGGKPHA
ncbi:MAG TPA: biotin transporter BioY [Candidatus Thermoplasmatota archaeon]|nr:biotin transporter BioY [Candidatus Thermoplasmatota archaeon]